MPHQLLNTVYYCQGPHLAGPPDRRAAVQCLLQAAAASSKEQGSHVHSVHKNGVHGCCVGLAYTHMQGPPPSGPMSSPLVVLAQCMALALLAVPLRIAHAVLQRAVF